MYLMRIANSADHDFYCGALTALVTGFTYTLISGRELEGKE
jgi:hypothetical protein